MVSTKYTHIELKPSTSLFPCVCVCVCVCVGVVAMALEEEQHRQHEGEIRDEKRSLKVELKEMELAHQDATKTLKMVSIYI